MIVAASWHPVALVGVAFALVSVALGLGVTYLAVRGYRRSGQRPMLFIAVGFALVLWIPLLVVLVIAIPSVDEVLFGSIAAISQTLGLLSIFYGLWMPRASDASDTV